MLLFLITNAVLASLLTAINVADFIGLLTGLPRIVYSLNILNFLTCVNPYRQTYDKKPAIAQDFNNKG
jgi:hypothetical protein